MYFRIKRLRSTIFIEAAPADTVLNLKQKLCHALAGTSGEPAKDPKDIRLQVPSSASSSSTASTSAAAASASAAAAAAAAQKPSTSTALSAATPAAAPAASAATAASPAVAAQQPNASGAAAGAAAVTYATLENAATIQQLALQDEQVIYMTYWYGEGSDGKWEVVEIAIPDRVDADYQTGDAPGSSDVAVAGATTAEISEGKGKERA